MIRDRYGEPVETDVEDQAAEHHCDAGWVDADADHPQPCLVCRPWLAGPGGAR